MGPVQGILSEVRDIDLIKLKELIDQPEHATITAEKYGPFFFALVFMCVIPTGLVFLYRYLFSSTSNSEIKKGLYTDFRIYFHVAVACGVICTVLSTAWWIYASYRYNEQSREAFEGLRSNIAAQETAINNMKKEDALQSYTAIGSIEDIQTPICNSTTFCSNRKSTSPNRLTEGIAGFF